jgi:hypothetical protein
MNGKNALAYFAAASKSFIRSLFHETKSNSKLASSIELG